MRSLFHATGLDNTIHPYIHSFLNHNVNGQQLLNIQSEDLERLGVIKLGHQEIILNAMEYLRSFHYELDKENLQLLALRLSSQAHSLHKELCRQKNSESVSTQTLSDVASIMMVVKPLVRWMDYPPFNGHIEYHAKKVELMKMSIEMATCAYRDRFAEKPVQEIRTICSQLATLADYIIQDITDPMILQPASLDLATLKKKSSDDLGFYILPSFHGVHQITEIKLGSAAHQSGKMMEGDQIVQVNYQTVVGWERKNLLELFRESPAEMLLTIKRRPRHAKVYGKIYIKPYKLPCNKNTSYATQGRSLPSPRPELLTIPDFAMPSPRHMPKKSGAEPTSILDAVKMLDTMTTDSSDSDSEAETPLYAKRRNLVQRRATITGASPTSKHGINLERFWKELKLEHNAAVQLRDKAASCAHGLDNVPMVNIRPQTCLGLESAKRKNNEQTNKRVQFEENLTDAKSMHPINMKEKVTPMQNCDVGANIVNKDINIEHLQTFTNNTIDSNNVNDTTVPLVESNSSVSDTCSINENKRNNKEIGMRYVEKRDKLDKDYTTSDLSDIERLDLFDHCLINTPNNNLTKININTVVENDDNKKLEDASSKCKEPSAGKYGGNVAQKINDIEKQIAYENTEEQECAFGVPKRTDLYKNNEYILKNDVNLENSTEEKNQNLEYDILDVNNKKLNTVKKLNTECEIATNKNLQIAYLKHSACEYHENAHCETINCTYAELLEKKFSSVLLRENYMESMISLNNNTKSIEDDSVNVTHNVSKTQINIKQQIKEAKSTDLPSARVTIQSCRFIELPKIQSVRKLEKLCSKSHVTPPEPPPRKYYTNQAITDLKLDNVPQTLEDLQKPQVPERFGIKQEFKKVDLSLCVNHIRSNSDCQDKKDSSDMLNYTENSMDFIGESRTVSLSDQKIDRSNLSDASLYNENNDKQSREEKYPFEKYETFVEKFVCSDQSITDCYRFDHSHIVDCPDGITYSKQTIPSDLKPRLSEKDKNIEKSVVNKAMMVAKSIGLHSSLNKSNNSPRSSRKRNVLLAKRRNVSVRDVGTSDLEGWLTYRSRGAGGAWAKAWFVLKCSSLYRFKLQDSVKADCLIVLTGFTVSPATEVKSRKYSFKVYHTGTVFYFAADTEDNLILWLDAVNKGTLGTDTQDQSVELFSETDESDSENHKSKLKYTQSYKANPEKLFGSLKKSIRKDAGSFKDHEIGAASLDRKYLKFLSARNIPVPTAQFRSYRRVLPNTSTSNKKEDCNLNSPDLQMTIAGSTFYGSSTSQNVTDISDPDMNDYRHADRKSENLQGSITQEEFAISQQDEEQRCAMINKSISTRTTPLLNDHVHVQHRNLNDRTMYNEEIRQLSNISLNNTSNIYDKTSDEIPNNNIMYVHSKNKNAHAPCQFLKDNFVATRYESEANDKSCGRSMTIGLKKVWDSSSYAQKRRVQELMSTQRHDDLSHWENMINPNKQNSPNQNVDYEFNKHRQSPNCKSNKMHDYLSPRNIGYSGSNHDLANHTSSETQQCIKKDVSINRKGSFNFGNNHNNSSSDKHWLESLKYNDKKSSNCDKNRLKNVAQYQPPPILTSPFEQEEMRATFEMHLDKNDHVQKTGRLKVLFGAKQQKSCSLELPKNAQKTISETSSLRSHKALRDKYCSDQLQHPLSTSFGSPNSGDNGINQSYSFFNNNNPSQTQTFCSVNSVNDPDAITSSIKSKYDGGYSSNYKDFLNFGRNLVPAVLPYIPPPTSPPPDYPGLEYPPVFEPGTYSLSDTSLLRNRNKNSQNTGQ
ncbi:Connector enhancer of kinase suppressor of ras 3 [Cyphomyrmex costatus]|uniref:Connector enhancer of kinase suppressor of ras 3 n=1 Tax=Cyphomyrmex costatus TaxID=456900 RepID=A0A151IIG2_9HYME|nr:Connector enhancer of kinase suppressor of ras 3 [Cyphomyrmex costatus]